MFQCCLREKFPNAEEDDGVGEKRSHSGDESKAMPVVAQ